MKNNCYKTYEEVFTYSNLFNAYKQCIKGVKWKASVQRFINKAPYEISKLHFQLQNNKYKVSPTYNFSKNEHGKIRDITAFLIKDRIVQRCLCDNYLIPLLQQTFIYDNSASQKDKGVHFAIKRCKVHLQRYIRKYGKEGYILQFDFHHFFASINHKVLLEKLKKKVVDSKIFNLIVNIITLNNKERGLGLGSQVSQTLALFYPSDLDHLFKDKLRAKYYGRYMDDGYIICHKKEEAFKYLEVLKQWCTNNVLQVNTNKTTITKLTKGFTFLKKHYIIKDEKIIIKLYKKNITKMCQKLKILKQKGIDISSLVKSYICSFKKYNSYFQLKRLKSI